MMAREPLFRRNGVWFVLSRDLHRPRRRDPYRYGLLAFYGDQVKVLRMFPSRPDRSMLEVLADAFVEHDRVTFYNDGVSTPWLGR